MDTVKIINGRWRSARYVRRNFKFLPFGPKVHRSDVKITVIDQNGSNTGGVIGGAVVGELLFGVVGGVAGAMIGGNSKLVAFIFEAPGHPKMVMQCSHPIYLKLIADGLAPAPTLKTAVSFRVERPRSMPRTIAAAFGVGLVLPVLGTQLTMAVPAIAPWLFAAALLGAVAAFRPLPLPFPKTRLQAAAVAYVALFSAIGGFATTPASVRQNGPPVAQSGLAEAAPVEHAKRSANKPMAVRKP